MRIKDYEKFQHFKDRRPPWIKLYRDILDDPEWFGLPGDASKVLVMLWLIASEDKEGKGNLPDLKTCAFRLRVKEFFLKQQLTKLSHWVYQDDIKMISTRYQDDTPETEVETEIETETPLVLQIISDLNETCRTNFRPTSQKTKDLINARLKEGYTLEDFKHVHRVKAQEWLNDSERRQYLRPITLYSPKFESYLQQKIISKGSAAYHQEIPRQDGKPNFDIPDDVRDMVRKIGGDG